MLPCFFEGGVRVYMCTCVHLNIPCVTNTVCLQRTVPPKAENYCLEDKLGSNFISDLFQNKLAQSSRDLNKHYFYSPRCVIT